MMRLVALVAAFWWSGPVRHADYLDVVMTDHDIAICMDPPSELTPPCYVEWPVRNHCVGDRYDGPWTCGHAIIAALHVDAEPLCREFNVDCSVPE